MSRKYLVAAGGIAVVVLLAVVGILYSESKEDPVVEIMAILENQANTCMEEINVAKAPGEECAFLLEVSDRIFEGSAADWAIQMRETNAVHAGNLATVNKGLQAYLKAIRLIVKTYKSDTEYTEI